MSVKPVWRAVPTIRQLSEAVIRCALDKSYQRDPVTARRLTLLTLLSRENYQRQASLISLTEARLP